jgi:NitT/TauT family transport system substrate-binding protein
VATLEDGLYATEATLNDPVKAERLARFVKASLQGWDYAEAHQDEAVKIVLDNDTAGAQTPAHQKRMMSEIAKLLVPAPHGAGYLDEAAYTRTVQELMAGGSDPVITRKPEGAWTHAVWDKAFGH